jgi:predicted Zn-dependent protease
MVLGKRSYFLQWLRKSAKALRPKFEKDRTIKIPLEGIVLIIFILGFAWFVYNSFLNTSPYSPSEETTTTSSSTTTTQLQVKKMEVNLNFSTPAPRLNNSCFITNRYFVYINDSLLRIIDPDFSKGIYNSTMNVTKTAFKIWEEETRLVHFDFVGPGENYTIYVEFTAEMPLRAAEKEIVVYAVGYALPNRYECENYCFSRGGEIYISPKESSRVFAIALHEIGHILNLADVGNRDSVMYAWQEEFPTFSESVWREKITREIKDTLKMIVKPEYDCLA